jgi:aspartate aminotransferase
VIIINGLSKGFAMTGYRLGYMACQNTNLVKACEKIQGQMTSGANAPTQVAAIAALTSDLEPTRAMVAEFAERRKMVMQLMATISHIRCQEPGGAFYVFPDVSAYFGKEHEGVVLAGADDLAMYLLQSAHVSTVTGSAFGEPNCLRISYAASRPDIEKGLGRIREALHQLT